MFEKKCKVEIDKTITRYLKILASQVTPIEAIFKNVDEDITDSVERVKLKMAFMRLMSLSIGLNEDAKDFLVNN